MNFNRHEHVKAVLELTGLAFALGSLMFGLTELATEKTCVLLLAVAVILIVIGEQV